MQLETIEKIDLENDVKVNLTNVFPIIFCVYGTLKRKHGNNRLLKDSEFLGEFVTDAKYTLYDGGFPIVCRKGNTAIHAELFISNDKNVINNIFSLEGCSKLQYHLKNWYDFDIIKTPFGDAVMFVQNENQHNRINKLQSGKWH